MAASVLTHAGLKVDLRIGAEEEFGDLLQHFTGSAAHNVQLRERAQARGLSVSEYGVAEVEGKKVHKFADEAGVYELLGLPYIEPELREGRGEIEAGDTGELPELVTVDDIRGDLHCHTTLSDGRHSLEEMAEAARRRGYAYLAVTDHSASHGFGNDVSAAAAFEADRGDPRLERDGAPRLPAARGLRGQHRARRVARLPRRAAGRARLGDLQRAYVLQHLGEGDDRAGDHRDGASLVDCIGHLTGRLLLRREPYAVDIERIAEAAVRTGTMMEINGNPNRRDLNEGHAKLAAEAGVRIVCNTDAHGTDTL